MRIRKIALAISLTVAAVASGTLAYRLTGDRTVKHCLMDQTSQAWYCSKDPVDREDGVQCPTEDSCTVSYQDGHWSIEPQVP